MEYRHGFARSLSRVECLNEDKTNRQRKTEKEIKQASERAWHSQSHSRSGRQNEWHGVILVIDYCPTREPNEST